MNEPYLDTAGFLRRFSETDTRVVLIGGMAAIAQGVPYVTQDIDFCYDDSAENRARLIEALQSLQPRLRVEGMTDDLARELGWRLDARALRGAPNLTLQTDAGPIDLLSRVTGLGGYAEVLRETVLLRIDGQEIPVLTLAGLMKAKRAAGRAKDMAVLPLLESTLLMRDQVREKQGDDKEGGA